MRKSLRPRPGGSLERTSKRATDHHRGGVPSLRLHDASAPRTRGSSTPWGRAPPRPHSGGGTAGAPPATPEGRLGCALFGEVLRLPADSVGTGGNFFDLGGHSLLATRLLARLRERTGTDVP
ncbi:hypothetical protein CLM85_05240, partial [Streptomyces albidoflavus]